MSGKEFIQKMMQDTNTKTWNRGTIIKYINKNESDYTETEKEAIEIAKCFENSDFKG